MADQNASTNKQVELDKAGILHASVAEAELDKVTIVSLGKQFSARNASTPSAGASSVVLLQPI